MYSQSVSGDVRIVMYRSSRRFVYKIKKQNKEYVMIYLLTPLKHNVSGDSGGPADHVFTIMAIQSIWVYTYRIIVDYF